MIAISLGSNIGERYDNLNRAKQALSKNGFYIMKESSIYESPADLRENASDDWQKNFLNQIVMGTSSLSPHDLLKSLKRIEFELGRSQKNNWGPREIDLDILF